MDKIFILYNVGFVKVMCIVDILKSLLKFVVYLLSKGKYISFIEWRRLLFC